jgi:hypothetical protein
LNLAFRLVDERVCGDAGAGGSDVFSQMSSVLELDDFAGEGL